MTRKRVSASLTMASAVALITMHGLLSGPALAHAQPLVPPPLAPVCTSWQFPAGQVDLLYPPIGKTVFNVAAGTHVDAPGQTIGDNGSPPLPVHVVGDILGHSLTLTVKRDNFEPLHFIGQIHDDNKAHGFYQVGKTGPEVNFQTAEPLVCQTAPAPDPGPAPVPAGSTKCSNWRLKSFTWMHDMRLSNGQKVSFFWDESGTALRTSSTNAVLDLPNGDSYSGFAYGGIVGGTNIDLTVRWTPDQGDSPENHTITSRFQGSIDDDTQASGTAVDSNNLTLGWKVFQPFICADG